MAACKALLTETDGTAKLAKDQVGRRDQLDSTRKTSPLVVPEGASVIDNNHLTLEQAVQAVAQLLRAQGLSVPEGDNP